MTQTVTATRAEPIAEAPVSRGEVAIFKPPRLPYHDAVNERFGVDRAGWKALVEAIFPNARNADSVIMALSYCRARKLDPFKRPVHIVPMWSSATGGYVETVWPGISELRTTAFRTGQYAGKEETEFGPDVTKTFKGTFKKETREVTITFPSWGRMRLTRVLNGKERVFVSPKVVWLETYAKWGNTDVPNEMWAKRTSGQFEKCVEAAALRCTFPEEIGNDLTAEEMEGQRIIQDVARVEADGPPAPPPPPPPVARQEPQTIETQAVTVDAQQQTNPEDLLKWIDEKLATVTDGGKLEDEWNDNIAPRLEGCFPPDYDEAMALYRKHEQRLMP